jgi:hypothetical protein
MTIRKSIRVERPPEISFKVFCEDISEWWPAGFGGKDSKVFLERAKRRWDRVRNRVGDGLSAAVDCRFQLARTELGR